MAKINAEEYEVLKALDDKWKYLARNNMYGAKLEAHTSRPYKMTDSHWSNGDMTLELLGGEHLFQFIQWEDEEPYNIAELIEEYEYKTGIFDWATALRRVLHGESEEAEVKKDKEWAIKEAKETINGFFDRSSRGVAQHYEDELIASIADIINQLDEPEVLSREWISENVEYAYFDMLDGSGRLSSATAIIKPEKLQNLIVPKQELPVIPKYVAKWISEHREEFDLCPALRRLEAGSTRDYPAYKWYRKNTRKFVNAYLTGEYEVEPTYYAKIKGHENIASNDKYWNYNTDMEELSIGDSEVHPNVISEYTIKATKDEWANLGITGDNADFELVEELEEC